MTINVLCAHSQYKSLYLSYGKIQQPLQNDMNQIPNMEDHVRDESKVFGKRKLQSMAEFWHH